MSTFVLRDVVVCVALGFHARRVSSNTIADLSSAAEKPMCLRNLRTSLECELGHFWGLREAGASIFECPSLLRRCQIGDFGSGSLCIGMLRDLGAGVRSRGQLNPSFADFASFKLGGLQHGAGCSHSPGAPCTQLDVWGHDMDKLTPEGPILGPAWLSFHNGYHFSLQPTAETQSTPGWARAG